MAIIIKYRAFTRNWWKPNAAWPDGREPEPCARRTYRGTFLSMEEARRFCKQWNDTHEPGPMSNKAEFEEVRKRGKYNAFLGREI